MNLTRIIPCLNLSNGRLVKTTSFANERYVGDPINTVKIFNDKEVNELVIQDINISKIGGTINFGLIKKMTGEAFMPVTYAGGVRSIDEIKELIRSGVEKVILNSSVEYDFNFAKKAVDKFGGQAIVGGIDVKNGLFGGHNVYIKSGTKKIKTTINQRLEKFLQAGVGEVFVNNISRDGQMQGYDLNLARSMAELQVPVVFAGGARNIEDIFKLAEIGISGIAAGSMFVFHGKHKAVLINYPNEEVLKKVQRVN
ncbi:HisA/HisF-related TIM barrel protein [Alphaproteobacteria bacterium]|nr:HisA/HisF-related TIM barrel protein [Alphaproteobacteria bacterium]